MTTHVHTTQTYPYPPSTIWPILSDFFTPWHPFISWCEQVDECTRRFGMPGQESAYVEQITDIDHRCHRFSYIMIQGIDDIESYSGIVYIEPFSTSESRVVWEAEITGPDQITEQIAVGTEAVFNAGLDEIANILEQRTIKTIVLGGNPRLVVDCTGSGDLHLFLHGIGGNRTNWHSQLNAFSDEFTCAALDFRGYGLSQLGNEEVTAHGLIEDILRVMAHFEAERIHLVGLSYGSWLAASFAHCHPRRIHSLVLCSGSTGMSLASADERARFRRLRLEPVEAGQTPAQISSAVVKGISGPNATAANKETLLASMRAIPRDTYIAAVNCFLNPPFQIEFEQFDFPTLFIAGEHDHLASPEEMSNVATRVPESTLAVVKGAGHLVNLESPEEYNQILRDFLNKVTLSDEIVNSDVPKPRI